MTPEQWKQIEVLFHAALERDPQERETFLASAGPADPTVKAEVERLLAQHDLSSQFIEPPSGEPTAAIDQQTLIAGGCIGSYRLVRVIATGGMGTVYEAVQDSPRRTVALKVMKPGIASPSLLRRFEYESQILGYLRHPAIAQVYEAGTFGEGAQRAPYFAMEYIVGAKTLTEYAESQNLTTRQRLRLFVTICDAVHHGHQKGVIHRDLKPANVVVDASGTPKVIDFGVARVTDSDIAVTTLHTDVGRLVGTLQYMSPEQYAADSRDLDTRSDVYSLGVVLYELLCGKLPHDVTRTPLAQAARVISEEAPPRPSTINRALRGDVETIVLKALEKDRERRYTSAADLGRDIEHYLNGEPIHARPSGAAYQFLKLVTRHKVPSTLLLALFALLATSTAVTTVQSNRVARERNKAEKISQFLQNMLASADPAMAGRDITVHEALKDAATRIETEFTDEPLVEASLRLTIGNTYRTLGDYVAAEPHCRRALVLRQRHLSRDDPDVATALNNLAWLLLKQGELDEAEPLFQEALRIRRACLGNDHPEVSDTLNNLGNLLLDKGEYAVAESLHRESLAIRRKRFGGEHKEVAVSLNNLAMALHKQDDLNGAEIHCREALAIRRKALGNEHPAVATSLNNLGTILRDKGDLSAAEPFLREALDVRRKILGNEHASVATSLNNLGLLLKKKGDLEAAEPLYREALAIRRKVLGPDHPRVGFSLGSLAGLLKARGAYDDAEELYREALAVTREAYGEKHPQVALCLSNLAGVLRDHGELQATIPLLQQAVEIHREVLGEDHPRTATSLNRLAGMLVKTGDSAGAEPLLREAVQILRLAYPPTDWRIAATESTLGGCLVDLGRYEEAETPLLQSYEALCAVRGTEDARTVAALNRIIELYEAWGKPGEVAVWRSARLNSEAMATPEE